VGSAVAAHKSEGVATTQAPGWDEPQAVEVAGEGWEPVESWPLTTSALSGMLEVT
jgi:hypothetical protein